MSNKGSGGDKFCKELGLPPTKKPKRRRRRKPKSTTPPVVENVVRVKQEIVWKPPATYKLMAPLPTQPALRFPDPEAKITFVPELDKLAIGPKQKLTVRVAETATYLAAELSCEIDVQKGQQIIEWEKFTELAYGSNSTPTKPKLKYPDPQATFEYTPDDPRKLKVGTQETITVSTKETDTFLAASFQMKNVTISKGQQEIIWNPPTELKFMTNPPTMPKLKHADPKGKWTATPAPGQFQVGVKNKITVTVPDTDLFIGTAAAYEITVLKGKPVLEWTVPTAVPFGAIPEAVVKNADPTLKPKYTPARNMYYVGDHQTLKVETEADDRYEAADPVTVTVNIKLPQKPSAPSPLQLQKAGVSGAVKSKITRAEVKPYHPVTNPSNDRIIGGHSRDAIFGDEYDPDDNPHGKYGNITVLSNNRDGTSTIKFQMRLPDGRISKPKTSTLAPEGWDEDAMMGATVTVGSTPPVATRQKNGDTLHRSTVNGVEWEVVKDKNGNVTASFPTGGNPTLDF